MPALNVFTMFLSVHCEIYSHDFSNISHSNKYIGNAEMYAGRCPLVGHGV